MRHMAGNRVRVFSAGSEPAEEVNPGAVKAMAEVGIDIAGAKPGRWTDEMLSDVDVVVSMGCGDECPSHPGIRRIDWQLDDPAGQGVAMVRLVRDEIRTRVRALLAEILGERPGVDENLEGSWR